MKKSLSVCAAALGLSLAFAASSAYATKPGNNGGGNGGCGNGQQTNGCGGTTPSTGNNTATGGAGGNGYGVGVGIGQGGQGGSGGKGGEGGSVWGSGNSSNVNANSNMQGQQQGQAQSSRNSNRNSATGGDASNSGNNSAQTVNVGGSTYEASRIPVATAYAPNIAPTATCMGSSSAGGQGMSFGFSVGTSWTDENCMKLERVRTVATVIGDPATAAQMMCDIPDYAKARADMGNPCGTVQTASAAPAAQPVAEIHQPKYVASAPIVVSPVPPRIERFRITTDGLQRVN